MLDEGGAGARARGGRHLPDRRAVGSRGEEGGQQGGGSRVPEGGQRDVLCGDQLENWRKYRVRKSAMIQLFKRAAEVLHKKYVVNGSFRNLVRPVLASGSTLRSSSQVMGRTDSQGKGKKCC